MTRPGTKRAKSWKEAVVGTAKTFCKVKSCTASGVVTGLDVVVEVVVEAVVVVVVVVVGGAVVVV